MGTVNEKLESYGLKKVLSYLDNNPEENVPKVLSWVRRFDREDYYHNAYDLVGEALKNPENNWYKLIMSLYDDIDSGVRKKMFENFLINSSIVGCQRKNKNEEKYDCNIPWAILMDPTSACNLHCKGCWAADYGNKMNMSFETLDSIIEQGKKLGTYMYIYSGGEPLVRKDDIIRLCEKHSDCEFLAFTNATLIDEAFADEMLRVKNFVPAISVEGFEEATDFRRGEGTYQAVIKAMEILKEKKLPFGISCCYTSKNTDVIGSEEYFDDMISKGAKFAWFFTYMPVGADAVPELMASAEQREFMYHQIRKFRETKPLFTMDFWNDGEYVQGCIAGGRCYLHINANGDIEPCAFIHYADSNIKDKTLLEAYQSPLFMQYRRNQPFNGNHLRPCPLLDNPGRLSDIVHKSGAQSTDMTHPEDVEELSAKCVNAAKNWAPVAERLWDESHPEEQENAG
ncbi:radical SAM protein [Clostridium sp. KNHs216]|uniref:radical SAM protein n=1 Tax=Clostridium sp. KNHs216 TaxID=1550235 RepID=UPI00114F080C|nr:radical SAM protein [Clostridium sp. KNHs216]TQI65902.1 MoaA/NifB/PqqE/SkfB family radical SAM enzyme [Clostridium sp. KNHs216]